MYRFALPRSGSVLVGFLALTFAGPHASAKDLYMKFTAPSNQETTHVYVGLEPYGSDLARIEPGVGVTGKRNAIREAIQRINPGLVVEDIGTNALVVRDLHDNTEVDFYMGQTGEAKDFIETKSPWGGTTDFLGSFSPFDWNGREAIFTAGIVTDVGELTATISASELNFQTEGPIICQALYQRLAPRAQQFGAQINYAGDRLEVYFDPAYTVTTGGVIFGTTSRSEGCSGTLDLARDQELHLELAGQCPGPVQLSWSGALPGTTLGILFAMNTGSYVIPTGPCAGTTLDLGTNQLRLYNTIGSGNGSGTVNAQAGPGACGGYVQLIAVPSCATSNVARVP